MISGVARLALELGSELWHEWKKKRAKDRAAKQWAETPNVIRGCPHCHEVNYVPGAISCRACGRML